VLPPQPEPEAIRSLFGAEYDRALAAVGLDRTTARCTAGDLAQIGVGRFQLPLYQALQAEPTLADRYARTFRDLAFAAAPKLETASAFAAARAGAVVRISLLGDPLAKEVEEAQKPGALEAAIRQYDPFRPGDKDSKEVPDTTSVPPRVRAAAALILRSYDRAFKWLLRDNGDRGPASIPDPLEYLFSEDEETRQRVPLEKMFASVDLNHLARAAAEVAVAVDRATRWLTEEKAAAGFEFRVETTWGTVLLRGGADDADAEGGDDQYLLRIDTGGNDRYVAGASTGHRAPFSVLIDVAGNDAYQSPVDAAAFGFASGGVAILVDLAGNDTYHLSGPKSLGLGAGVFGVGMLLDAAGDDVYSGENFCMGAATVGWGTLCDLGGKDRYEAFRYSQGFGHVLGAGVLTDLGGDDTYVLNDKDIRNPSAQSKEHNDSLGQGFGFGLRADYLDGHSLAGGVGILADREGNDTYSCGVFGQGAGYWMGVGMLLDGAGSDSYTGAWYVQGACAHFAIGILDDGGGDDRYTASLNMAQGAGHDYSVGVLLDRGGNDRYSAPNLSLGGGNAQGVGLFVDAGGDDEYRSHGTTLGLANADVPPESPTLRHGSLTLGVFLDLGGKDAFLDAQGKPWPFAGDGRLWRQAERVAKPPFSNERGVGVDR
jgi:hypothetical protein